MGAVWVLRTTQPWLPVVFFWGCDLSEGGVAAPAAGGCSSPSGQDEWRPPRLGHGSKPWKFAIRDGCLDGCHPLTALPSKNPAASQSCRSPRPQLLHFGAKYSQFVCLSATNGRNTRGIHTPGWGWFTPTKLEVPPASDGSSHRGIGFGKGLCPTWCCRVNATSRETRQEQEQELDLTAASPQQGSSCPAAPEKVQIFGVALQARPDWCVEGERERFVLVPYQLASLSGPFRSVDISPTRLHSLAQHFRHRSSSLESQGKLLGSENETGSPDFYTPRTRSSNGSDPMDDCSSCTSHSSSEHYYPAQMNPNYSTLAEDSPSKARERQRQRHKSAGNLVSSNSGSMPNLAARNGTGHHRVYLHSQSQPSSQYRIKEYPLYIEGSSTPVVVRSLENDQEGHYSVKAQFKTSNSYTAGGMFKENWHGDEADSVRLTPSRSQIIRTPSLGREGHEKGSGRTAVSDELRLWYQRSTASHKEHSRLSHTSSTSSDSSSQYSTSSQSTFVAHSRVTRMPQMCKATSGESPWGGGVKNEAWGR